MDIVRKTLISFLSLLFIFSLTACGDEGANNTSNETAAADVKEVETEESVILAKHEVIIEELYELDSYSLPSRNLFLDAEDNKVRGVFIVVEMHVDTDGNTFNFVDVFLDAPHLIEPTFVEWSFEVDGDILVFTDVHDLSILPSNEEA